MRILFERFQLRKDFDTLNFLKRSLFVLGVFGLGAEFFHGFITWGILIKAPVLYFLYRMLFQTFEKFYYSYWTFNIILFIYILWSLYKSLTFNESSLCAYIYTLMLFANGIKTFIIASPIYFPVMNWWEYDFRFRRDIPLEISSDDDEDSVDGRLIDIRREAAGIQSFKTFKVGQKISVNFKESLDNMKLVGNVYSIRKYSYGRPYILGVKFDVEKSDVDYQKVVKFWHDQKTQIKNLRSLKHEKK